MPLAQCSLQVEANRMERQPVGRSLFPCHAYRGDVHQYIASQVPPHWHHEVELFMLDQGEVKVSAAETQFLLQPGQGVLVNTDKLHSMTCAVESPCRYRSLVFDPSIVAGPRGTRSTSNMCARSSKTARPPFCFCPAKPGRRTS